MKTLLHFAIVLLFAGAGHAQVVDRMVAVVNKQVIMESELDQAARVECLLQGKPIEKLSPADRSAVLERLIDRALLDQQIANPALLAPTPIELAARIKEVRADMPQARTDEGWNEVLAGYGITEKDLEDQLTAQSRILRFIDLRFRGIVRVEKDAIADYYQKSFLPEVHKRNAPEPKLAEVSDKIEQILAEQQIDSLLTNWLKTLRTQAHIERMFPETPPANVGAEP
ncbi:MAG TPA: SurA N-terminal domain-containing protein [Candidatus Angelobacter sp.]